MKAWKKGLIVGVAISTLPYILLWVSWRDWKPKTSEDAMAGVGMIIGLILVLLFAAAVISFTTLIGYSFDRKDLRFRVLGVLWGIISIVFTTAYIFLARINQVSVLFKLTVGLPSYIPMTLLSSQGNTSLRWIDWTFPLLIIYLGLPLVFGYLIGYFLDNKRRRVT